MAKKRVFVSFDFDNDKVLKDFIIGQSRNEDSPFEVVDVSMKEAEPQRNWASEARRKIRSADVVVVMVGSKTHEAPGVLKEVGIALDEGISIYQIIGYRDSSPVPVPGAGRLMSWNWENLKNLFKPSHVY